MKRKIIICDLDGTISDSSKRKHYLEGGKKNFKAFYDEMSDDPIRKDVWDAVKAKAKETGAEIVFMTGRPEEYRIVTKWWLYNNGIFRFYDYGILLMRENLDHREDTVVKKDLLDNHLSEFEVVCAYDDRPKVIRMWRDCGFEVVDVGDGKEF